MGRDHPLTPAALGVAHAQRHAFLCVGPDCCASADGAATWETLKSELKGVSQPVLRTKAACLRLCQNGPWLVVYPDGIWYDRVTPEKCKAIVKDHLEGGVPVKNWIAATGTMAQRAT